MMKSSSDGTIKTYATFRVSGDALVPEDITDILGIFPTLGYQKGQRYGTDNNSIGGILGRTGVWYLSTDKVVASQKLHDHVMFILNNISPEFSLVEFLKPTAVRGFMLGAFKTPKLERLIRMQERRHLTSAFTLFWHGTVGSKHPSVPKSLILASHILGSEVESNFDSEESDSQHVA